jgi:predicted DNA-binding transcriptional regulator YafY
MPVNKNASYRYRLINYCLRNRARKWTIDSLVDYISERLREEFDVERGISERSLYSDFAVMRKYPPEGYGAPIVIKNRQVSYSDPDFSIDNVPLNNTDMGVLQEAIALLRQVAGLPHVEELLSVARKLGGVPEPDAGPVVHIERNERLTGLEYLRQLYDSIRTRQPVTLHYRPFGAAEPLRPVVHPYLLKEYNNRWFLLGWSETDALLRIYALDRIEALLAATSEWIPNGSLNPDTYFRDIIGVSIPEDMTVHTVRLRFSAYRAPYVMTKPLHPSQKTAVLHPDGRAEVDIRVIINPELRTLLLGFGPDVEVLQPPALRLEIAAALQQALSAY